MQKLNLGFSGTHRNCWGVNVIFFFFLPLSPSGCTFWGKKPWSRKKKILWQLGTLIGAPVGISLIAGIAIPAMVIGIPVYVGRKVSVESTRLLLRDLGLLGHSLYLRHLTRNLVLI